MNIMDDYLTACLATARAPPIRTKQSGRYFDIRGNLHVLLTVPPGGGKTTGMLEDVNNVVKAGDISIAGLLGTVNGKTGDFVPGAATLAAGKVLWIDEYQTMRSNVRDKLLTLIETGEAQRSLGFNLKDKLKKGTKYGLVTGKKGTGHFDVISRFSCMLTGTVKPSVMQKNYMFQGNGGKKAWMSTIMFLQRFAHLNLLLDDADFYRVIRGEKLFSVKDYSQYYTEPVVMDDYLDIVHWHEEVTSGEDFRFLNVLPPDAGAFRSRNCLDIVRMEAAKRAIQLTLGKSIFHSWENQKKHVAYSLFNVVTNSLTFSEYKVFMNLLSKEPVNQEQVARDIGISQQAVSRIEKKLENYGLLDGDKSKEVYNFTTKSPPLKIVVMSYMFVHVKLYF